jgi:hypothetical protein
MATVLSPRKTHPSSAARSLLLLAFLCASGSLVTATPAHRTALGRHYERFLARELNRCTTCHLPSDHKAPESLEEFPHNPFGDRLRRLGEELKSAGQPRDVVTRLALVAEEDTDGDGVANELEILLGHQPGNEKDAPAATALAEGGARRTEFAKFAAAYRWRPFETVRRPAVPEIRHPRSTIRNPVDAFIGAEHEARGLKPQPEASREILLRRVYLDLIGLSPTPEEQRAFLADTSADAYEKVVDGLLNDPRHGERWGRHWMDVWRYSDWAGWSGGNQIRDSKPHIWRWRDWIVESLNADKSYDRMVVEMLAADELAPEDTDALRATGFLVRNFKMLSREQWMEDVVKHTSQAFLGVTMGCAKCHDHMTDPISQVEYYRLRAVFEPHDVRTDHIPGQTDTAKDGLVRAFDKVIDAPTYRLIRGDERRPDKAKAMEPGVPAALCGATNPASTAGTLVAKPVQLPPLASQPDRRDFVIRDMLAASERAIAEAREALEKRKGDASTTPEKLEESALALAVAEAKHIALQAVVKAETLDGDKDSAEWKSAATAASEAQRRQALAEARLKSQQAGTAVKEAMKKADAAEDAAKREKADKAVESAKQKLAEAGKALADAEKEMSAAPSTACKPRSPDSYPATSTGRRLAFAQWIADPKNPLTARVAMNHLWLRHFGRGLVPTAADFGSSGRAPSHPQLLDWLAAEFMDRGWSMKAMHRLLVTSAAYRRVSTPVAENTAIDEDNVFLWRANSRRLEAEAVRDNVLAVAGSLDLTMGGPDIDHTQGLTSRRRSIYLRLAAEKEVEFLKIFDGPSVTECYERHPSIVPQQALALANSEFTRAEAKKLAASLTAGAETDDGFVRQAFERILARGATADEVQTCREFLTAKANPDAAARRENLILVLLNHHDFVTVR